MKFMTQFFFIFLWHIETCKILFDKKTLQLVFIMKTREIFKFSLLDGYKKDVLIARCRLIKLVN